MPLLDLIGIAEAGALPAMLIGSGAGEGEASRGVAIEAAEMRSSRLMASDGGAVFGRWFVWRSWAMPEGPLDVVLCKVESWARLYMLMVSTMAGSRWHARVEKEGGGGL